VVNSLADLEKAMVALGGQKQGLYGEKWVNFTKVRPEQGSTLAIVNYPIRAGS
jgi:hypothetical protein